MNADDAWVPLAAALQDYEPPCSGWDMFTTDWLTDKDRSLCAFICERCPIADPCGAYASAAKVDSGFWAGTDRSPKRKRATSTTEPGGSR